MTFEKGSRVNTPLGPGTVAYVRMRPPDYAEPDAISVVLDSRTEPAPWYTGTIFAAHKITPIDPDPDPEIDCDLTPIAPGEWRCLTHNVVMIAKNEPVRCTRAYELIDSRHRK